MDKIIENSILHEIDRWGEIIVQNKPLRPLNNQIKLGFANEKDWRYGHFVGMIEGLAILYHHVMNHRQITPAELNEIEEFISKNLSKYQKLFFK